MGRGFGLSRIAFRVLGQSQSLLRAQIRVNRSHGEIIRLCGPILTARALQASIEPAATVQDEMLRRDGTARVIN